MATTKCLDCKKEVSTTADKCPHCGSNVPSYTKGILMLVSFGLALYLLKGCFF
jgi:RNA polymerase subunit RPABC4/transcription elongation factor Spt4